MSKFPGFFAYPSHRFAIEIPGKGWIGGLSVSNITKEVVPVPQPPDPVTGKAQAPVLTEVVGPVVIESAILDVRDGTRPRDRLTAGDVFLNGFREMHDVVVVHSLSHDNPEPDDVVELRRYTLTGCKVLSYTLARHDGSVDGVAMEVVAIQPKGFTMETVQPGEDGKDFVVETDS